MTDSPFAGRTVIVTGGSRGIGRATALRLAAEGARVAVVYRSRKLDADATLEQIKQAGGQAVAISADIARPEEATRIAEQTRRAFGPIDMLAHCAAISIVEPADDVTWETWKSVMDINLDGTYNIIYAVKDEMIDRRFGRIVVVSSIAALRERANQVHYSASKAAVIAVTRCLAQAWGKHNIRVNCMAPGLTKTEMSKLLSPQVTESIIEATPLGRVGEPEEIAAVIRFLLSEESSFMTGQTVVASGGRTMLPG